MKLDVIKLAKEVDAYRYTNRHFKEAPTHTFTLDKLERFAALVIEECERVCEQANTAGSCIAALRELKQ